MADRASSGLREHSVSARGPGWESVSQHYGTQRESLPRPGEGKERSANPTKEISTRGKSVTKIFGILQK